jgi:polyprenyldihydroxybenzoate methyltransferase/3-demethylubiquinol 3-O-methyltransferase
LVEALARRKADVTGLDPNEALLQVAREHIEPQPDISSNARYLLETIEEHCVKYPNYYDVIVCSEVLEHVLDKKSLLDAACKALKPGGSIFVTTFNKTFYSWFFGILWGQWILKVVPSDCHSYGLFVSPKDVSNILMESNCKTNILRGTFYDIIRRKWLVNKWTGFHYAMQAVKAE